MRKKYRIDKDQLDKHDDLIKTILGDDIDKSNIDFIDAEEFKFAVVMSIHFKNNIGNKKPEKIKAHPEKV